jgi:hypothetical protein
MQDNADDRASWFREDLIEGFFGSTQPGYDALERVSWDLKKVFEADCFTFVHEAASPAPTYHHIGLLASLDSSIAMRVEEYRMLREEIASKRRMLEIAIENGTSRQAQERATLAKTADSGN